MRVRAFVVVSLCGLAACEELLPPPLGRLPEVPRLVSLRFCDFPPTWLAYQNGDSAWTVLPMGADSAWTFTASPRVSVAFARAKEFTIWQVAASELAARALLACKAGTGGASVSGSFQGKAFSYDAATMGSFSRYSGAVDSVVPFTFTNLPGRPMDLVAVRTNASEVREAAIIRRSIDPSSPVPLPILDLGGAEAKPMPARTLALPVAYSVTWSLRFETRNGTGVPLESGFSQASAGGPWSDTVEVLDPLILQPDDMHVLVADILPSQCSSATCWRQRVTQYFGATTNVTVTKPPTMPTPLVSVAASAPYARFVVTQQASTGQLSAVMLSGYQVNSSLDIRSMTHVVTAGYFGASPSVWTFSTPDLSALSGWSPSWGFGAGRSATLYVRSHIGRGALLLGAPPVAGDAINWSEYGSDYSIP